MQVPDGPVTSAERFGGAGLWHVTLTLGGEPVEVAEVRAALERLAHQRPFVHAARYAARRAELRYWEEACTVTEAVRFALVLWGEHRVSAALPPWHVVGLEVLDEETFRWRLDEPGSAPAVAAFGDIRPF